MDDAPRDYRSDTNGGVGWLVVHEFYRSLYEGDPRLGESHFPTLGEARLNARQLGCARGIAAVAVVPPDERERRVCWWDKRVDGYWHDEEWINAFELELDRRGRSAAGPSPEPSP